MSINELFLIAFIECLAWTLSAEIETPQNYSDPYKVKCFIDYSWKVFDLFDLQNKPNLM
jgi:hypothetical protein